nr:ras-like GTP-binding protein rhoA isoform X2 [Dermacentor andersoni]
MLDPVQVLWLVAVAALWGFSAPLLRRGGKGVEDIKRQGALNQWLAEVKFLATRPQYVLPFLINQSGSAIYALALGSADLSLAVPLTNSLNFIFVTLAGRILGETTTSTPMLTLKVVVVGSCACGKTTLIRTFLRDDVRGSVPAPTVQEVYVGHMQHDGKKVRLVIWDTGDSDLLCDPHRASCYAEADVVLICFSVRDIFSGSEVPTRWATEVRHFNPNVPVLLVATQMDLREDPVTVQELAQIKCRPSSVAEGLQLAQKIQAAHYVECSALDLASVRKVFESVLHTCLRTTQSRQKKSRWKCCC